MSKIEIVGYTTTKTRDLDGEIVDTDSLDISNTSPVILWEFDPTRPAGRIVELSKDEKGLICRAEIDDELGGGREALALIEAGRGSFAISATSARREYEMVEGDVTPILKDARLRSISVTLRPSNTETTIKEENNGMDCRD
jgi:HK97 family phage prohead protease